jgi:flagellar biosynthesis protein FlhB
MNPLKHVKKLFEYYKIIESPSKKILKYGGLIALSLMILASILFIYSSYTSNAHYLALSFTSARSSANIMILVLISMFVLDIVYQN